MGLGVATVVRHRRTGGVPFLCVEAFTGAPIGRDQVLVWLRGRAARPTERPPQLAVHSDAVDYLVAPLATTTASGTGEWQAGYVMPMRVLKEGTVFALDVDGVREHLPALAQCGIAAAGATVSPVPREPLVDTLTALASIVEAERATLARTRDETRFCTNRGQLDSALGAHADAIAEASARGVALREALGKQRRQWETAFANAVDHQRKVLRLGERARREASELARVAAELARSTDLLECRQAALDEEDTRAKHIRLADMRARIANGRRSLYVALTGRSEHAPKDERGIARLHDWESKSRGWCLEASEAVRRAEEKARVARVGASASTCDLLTTLTRYERARVSSRAASARAHEELLALEQRVVYERLEVDAALERVRATRRALEAAQIALELNGERPRYESAAGRTRRFARGPRRAGAPAI